MSLGWRPWGDIGFGQQQMIEHNHNVRGFDGRQVVDFFSLEIFQGRHHGAPRRSVPNVGAITTPE
jgi:hypothetical protein